MSALDYAPAPTDATMRAAALAAARHFGTEAVQINGCATEDSARTVVAFRVDGRQPGGWAILGDSVVVHVADDGTVTLSED